VAELRQLPPKWALLVYQERKPYVLRAPVAAKRWRLRRAFLPWPIVVVPPVVTYEESAVQQEQPAAHVLEAPVLRSAGLEVGPTPELHVIQQHGAGTTAVVDAED